MTLGFNLSIICMCLLLQAFFSGSEMVLLSSNKLKLRRMGEKKSASARLALEMMKNSRWYLASTSTGTNMSVIVSSVVAAVWFESIFGVYGELMTILIMSPILLMFGEIIPRAIFQQRATESAPKIARPFWVVSRLIAPVTVLIFWLSKLFYRRVGKESIEKHSFITREELELVLQVPGKESDVQGKEKKLISRVFHLSKSNVADVMVPLVNVTVLSHKATINDAVKIIRRTGFSRIPVFKDRIYNLVGMIHAFDLIDINDPTTSIEPLIREIPFIPELTRADSLLVSLQKNRQSIAIAVDEYGGAVGIITIEDILEEVVGDISDEYDREVKQIIKITDTRSLISARMEISDINEQLNINIPEEDYETVGGYLLKRMGKVPKKGETYRFNNLTFTIRRSSKRSIYEIIIDIAPPA